MIRANCRERFTADDFQFIANVLAGKSKSERNALSKLLSDEDSRDLALDDKALFDKVTAKSGFPKISPFLYFYLLTRRALLENQIDARSVADYVASMLAHFCVASRAQTISSLHENRYEYMVDMMIDSLEASSFEAFLLRSHMGNHALFVTGIFPERVYYKATYGRRAPGFDYYEKMGSSSYRWASRHQYAPKFELENVFDQLADHFQGVRLALNRLSDNYMSLAATSSIDRLLRQMIFSTGSGNPPAEA